MAQDTLSICEIVLGAVFGAVFIMIVGLSIFGCVQRQKRMTMRRRQCEEVLQQTDEKQQKLDWLTGVTDLAENESLFSEGTSSNASFASRASQK